jgi:hypothetical protein
MGLLAAGFFQWLEEMEFLAKINMTKKFQGVISGFTGRFFKRMV